MNVSEKVQNFIYFFSRSCLVLIALLKCSDICAYDISDRYQFLEDQRTFLKSLRNGSESSIFQFDLSTHPSAIGNLQNMSGLDQSGFNTILTDQTNSDQALLLFVELKYQFSTFDLEDFELTPSVFVNSQLGALSTVRNAVYTREDLEAFLLSAFPDLQDQLKVRSLITNLINLPSAGENIFQHFMLKILQN